MPVAMRLMRMGTTHNPVYRISVGDSRKRPTAKFIEHIGTYNPKPDKMGHKQLRLNVARAKYWIAMGVQPSSMVARLLSRFHLLPVPPSRITVPTGTLLHRVLAGEDIRDVMQLREKQARHAASLTGRDWTRPEISDALQLELDASAQRKFSDLGSKAEDADGDDLDVDEIKDMDGLLAKYKDPSVEFDEADFEVSASAASSSGKAAAKKKGGKTSAATDKLWFGEDVTQLSANGNSLRDHRWFREPSAQRVEQLKNNGTARWKLQQFPIEFEPTPSTQAAWEQARRHHYTIPQHPSQLYDYTYRQKLRQAERRAQRRRDRAADGAAGRVRPEEFQKIDILDDWQELIFRRAFNLEAPRPLGEEQGILIDVEPSKPLNGEQLEERERVRVEGLARFEAEVRAAAEALGVRLPRADFAEDADLEADELAAADAEAVEESEDVRGSDGEGEEDAPILPELAPGIPAVPLSRNAQKTLRLMIQSLNLGEVDSAITHRAQVSYGLLNEVDKAEIDFIMDGRRKAREEAKRIMENNEQRLSAMAAARRSEELQRRATAWVEEHSGRPLNDLRRRMDELHFDALSADQRVRVLKDLLREREAADVTTYIQAQMEAQKRNDAKQAAAHAAGRVMPEGELEYVDTQAIEEFEATRSRIEKEEAEEEAAEEEAALAAAAAEFGAEDGKVGQNIDPEFAKRFGDELAPKRKAKQQAKKSTTLGGDVMEQALAADAAEAARLAEEADLKRVRRPQEMTREELEALDAEADAEEEEVLPEEEVPSSASPAESMQFGDREGIKLWRAKREKELARAARRSAPRSSRRAPAEEEEEVVAEATEEVELKEEDEAEEEVGATRVVKEEQEEDEEEEAEAAPAQEEEETRKR